MGRLKETWQKSLEPEISTEKKETKKSIMIHQVKAESFSVVLK